MRVLVDTNVLGRLSQPSHPLHAAAIRAVKSLHDAQHELRIVPQVIYEYWVVATRPIVQNGLGFSIETTAERLAEFKALFPPLRDERGILERWERLVVAHCVRGKPAHDARLIAAMEKHGLSHLLTFDSSDFPRYGSVQVIDPAQVAAS
jgi:predicted nucleic acid-binding protein